MSEFSDTIEPEASEHPKDAAGNTRRRWLHSWGTVLKKESQELGRETWNACKLFIILLLICGVGFPLVIYAVGQLVFPFQANGSLITTSNQQVVGSSLIGQTFTNSAYFHGRPSATGYDASSSSGSNIGPTNPQLLNGNGKGGTYAGVKSYAEQFLKENHLPPQTRLPADIVTASGSGLDPDISVEAAQLQMQRIVQARHALGGKNDEVTMAVLRDLIGKHTSDRQFGFLGEPRVNVLELNLDLDRLYAAPAAAH